ncbi:MAG: riboflavin synthase [Candidatus Dormibacteraceae bacterium]
MFTGIVSGVGAVAEERSGHLGITDPATAAAVAIGGSVAVNGVCLTVVAVEGPVFFADVVPETLRRTNLGRLRPGDRVNLERPLTASQPLDGHLVQGHVDATARILTVTEVALGREVTVELPAEVARYVAEKGSITVDGTSLTVAGVDRPPGTFTVALIPHTLAGTVAGAYVLGDIVNLEVDVIARYAERLVRASTGRVFNR